jgi:pilus assembly protein CpaB
MRSNIVIMFVLAVISGGIAVFLANVWLNNQSQQVAVVAPTPAVETSTIVVAATNLGYGVPLQQETLREIPWPKASVPDGAYAKISDVLTDGRRVVLSPISPNEPVLKWKISGPGARASLSALVTDGMRAVAVRVNDVVGVGGFVLPGDRIDLLYTRNGTRDQVPSTDILIQNVRVLAIDQEADQKKDQP